MARRSGNLLVYTIVILIIVVGAVGAFWYLHAGRDDNQQRNDEVQAVAVVTAHELATQSALETLDAGGTAADAAVAAAATLSVVEPWFSSALGGGTWALYYDAETDEITSLDGVGPVGSNASVEDYEARQEESGMHQAIVPGAWDGWMLWLEEYGNLELGTILNPAIEVAREGYEVYPLMEEWLDIDNEFDNRPDSAEIYVQDGEVVRVGDTVHQHDMADTFEALVEAYNEGAQDDERTEGIQAARDYFYRGPIAEAIVDYSDEHDGYLTLEDFHNFEAEIVDAISIDYDDEVSVFQSPPNSQGITMLLALNILKDYDFTDMDPESADAIHLQAEAYKLAFGDRYHHVGDPDRVDVPISELLSEEHTDRQRQRIDMEQAMEWPLEDGLEVNIDKDAHTTTFHIVDKDGNGAAVTTSLGAQFYVIGDTGIHMNYRMRFLSLEDNNPNQLTPGYKVRHTSNPYMAIRNGNLYMLGGNTGADTQAQAQAQQFINVREFGFSAQDAISQPRFISRAFPKTTVPHETDNDLTIEDGYPENTLNELRERGHEIELDNGIFGSGGLIILSEDGTEAEIGRETRSDVSSGEIR